MIGLARRLVYRLRWGDIGRYVSLSREIPGWIRGLAAAELARASYRLPPDAVVVEVGSFMGSSAVLLAGGRKLRGSGRVHCIDPFDGSGDEYSVPVYEALRKPRDLPLRTCFERNLREAGLSDWVNVHQGTACEIAAHWSLPVDLLLLDGDHSYDAVRRTYAAWSPFLKRAGVLVVHNSRPRPCHPSHDGSIRLVAESIQPPQYGDIRCIHTTTFAEVQKPVPEPRQIR